LGGTIGRRQRLRVCLQAFMAPKTAPKFPPRAHTGKLGGIQKQVWETAAEARANEASEAQAMPEEETAAARAENERARAA